MSLNWTPIQWTWAQGEDGQLIPMSGSTWNPILGCKELSPGCANCYSARLIGVRFSHNPSLPMYHDIATTGANGHPHFTGARRMMPSRLDEPLRARKGRKIFVNDMGDLFFEGHPFEDIAAVFGVMASARQHTFQVLTKRPERVAEFFAWIQAKLDACTARGVPRAMLAEAGVCHEAAMDAGVSETRMGPTCPPWPLPNVWIGTSVENRATLHRIDTLRAIPAAVRFLSVEPLLEDLGTVDLTGIHLVIVGGESGKKARPFDLAWARSLRDQCRAAGVAYFFKQAGAKPVESIYSRGASVMALGVEARVYQHTTNVSLDDPHGGDLSELPFDLRVREFPPAVRQ